MTEAFRIDLAQSPLVTLVGSSALGDALDRMKQPRNALLTTDLARELAQREGAKAVVVGDISPVGKGYVLTARLVTPQDGSELVALRETADDDGQILKAIDRLSKSMRERIGESLRSIRANEPLEQVTTGSLEALRLYTEGNRASDLGESEQAISLLKQAVAIDSGFAMAWRKLAVAYSNSGSGQALVDAATRAYAHRDRLPEMERLWPSPITTERRVRLRQGHRHLPPDAGHLAREMLAPQQSRPVLLTQRGRPAEGRIGASRHSAPHRTAGQRSIGASSSQLKCGQGHDDDVDGHARHDAPRLAPDLPMYWWAAGSSHSTRWATTTAPSAPFRECAEAQTRDPAFQSLATLSGLARACVDSGASSPRPSGSTPAAST